MLVLARRVDRERAGRGWWTWSGGPSCAGSISSRAGRSRSWCAGPGCRGTRSAGRCGQIAAEVSAVPERPSKLDPFKDGDPPAVADDPKLTGVRVRELIEPLGFDGGKTIVDDYLREVRPLFVPPPDVSADGLSAGGDLPVRSVGDREPRCRSVTARRGGRGSWSRAWAIRARARGRWCSARRPPDLLWGMARCLWPLGALPRDAGVGSRGGCTATAGARRRRMPRSAGSCGSAGISASRRDPAGQGRGRAAAGVCGDQLRARSAVR